jgi:hypothetical protein
MKRWIALLALVALPAFAQTITDTRPATRHAAITPTDATALVDGQGRLRFRAIIVECADGEGVCDVSITDCVPSGGTCSAGATVVYTVPSGTLLPFQPWSVNDTGTTDTAAVTGWW